MGGSGAVLDGGHRRRWIQHPGTGTTTITANSLSQQQQQHQHSSLSRTTSIYSTRSGGGSSSGSGRKNNCCVAAIEAGLRRRMPLRRYLGGGRGAVAGSGGNDTKPSSAGGGGIGAALFGAWTGGGSADGKGKVVGLGGCTTTAAISSTATLGSRAMRYYRLWIYTCNTALLAGALAFIGTFTRMVVFDYRRHLVPSLTLYQPSFLYAYLALATQGGALQLLGCVAAVRLSERLLNAYWVLLLVLLFGDLVIGAFWAFRFETVCSDLRHTLKIRWRTEYTSNMDLWDRFQMENNCCGATGSSDFNISNTITRWEMPLPLSCCIEPLTFTTSIETNTTTDKCQHNTAGCGEKLIAYLKVTASVLAILGYCVLAFLKLTFLGILRYEIREMIQKIRILRTEVDLLPSGINGGVPGAGCSLRESAESERESLLLGRPDSSLLLSSPPQQSHHQHLLQQQQAAAAAAAAAQQQQLQLQQQLILQQQQQQYTPTAPPAAIPAGCMASGIPGTTKMPNPNGNNNYEMREYHRSHENI